jgi:hypothetical protein
MSEGRRHTLLVDKDDERVTFVQTVPGFAINQTRENECRE